MKDVFLYFVPRTLGEVLTQKDGRLRHQGVLEAKSKMQIRDSLFFVVFQECQVKISVPGFKKIFFRHFMSLPLQKL